MSANPKQTTLLPAYLIVGEDELKRETVLKRLHARLDAAGDLALNSETFSGETCSGEQIVQAANTLPFLGEVRLVEVHNAERLRKADLEPIVEYLKQPCPTTVLALEAQKLQKSSRLYQAVLAISPKAVIDCAPVARKNLSALVRSMAVGQGITFSEGAAAALIDLVGTNTVSLDAEIRKLALAHRGSDPVNESEVISLVSRTAEVKPWEFVDAFAARNPIRCLHLLNRMGSTSPYALLAMCTTRLRELITAKSLAQRGEGERLAAVLKMPGWRVKNHRAWAKGFTMPELERALRSARDAEQAMKSGANPSQAFEAWFLSVTTR